MSHMVIFRTPEGKPGYQPADTVEEAVAVVERLRNEDGVENVRIFRLEEVAFEYKPYYKVELAGGGGDEPRGRSVPTAILEGSGPTDVDEPGAAGDEADAEDGAPADAPDGDEASVPADETFAPESETPPWAAPPPPPPAPVVEPPAAEVGGFGDEPGDVPAEDHDDEFSGAGGQRRGLFGR